MPLFSKAEVGMALSAFARQVGIPNELRFDRAADHMGLHRNSQCAIRKFRIECINSETCSPCQNRADNLIGIIKGGWKRRTDRQRIHKNCWSFGLVWEADMYSHTSYKGFTTGMERITGDNIDIS